MPIFTRSTAVRAASLRAGCLQGGYQSGCPRLQLAQARFRIRVEETNVVIFILTVGEETNVVIFILTGGEETNVVIFILTGGD